MTPGADPIRLELTRSGGFAGRTVRSTVDTSELSADDESEVRGLLSGVDLAALSAQPTPDPVGADRYHYDLTVQEGGTRLEVSLPESAVPGELKPLLRWLTTR